MATAARSPVRNLPPLPLPQGITEDYVFCPSSDLNVHYLECGYTPERNRPLILLCHGYPELAFSWRKIMPSLANAGYYVVAFDQRGYGRTTGWDDSTFAKTDLSQFTMTNLVRDVVILVNALGYREVQCVIGHDAGSRAAAMCALMRPDFFRSVIMMSHPFKTSFPLPFNLAHGGIDASQPPVDIQRELAKLPEPRKHYKYYNATAVAALQWNAPAQGLKAFLRGYLHVKSADWRHNKPGPLEAWTASELAKMPFYYIMPYHKSMPETIAHMMEGEDESKTKRWMSDDDLDIYVQEWTRTGFQGGLNWYRTSTDPIKRRDLDLFDGKNIECPSTFISGAQDWGNYQEPGAVESFPQTCSQFKGVRLIEGAGHWPQQEQPEKVTEEILSFLSKL